jgi:prepilin-type N-terminal cleavage/methylation domain-containing protein
MESSMFLCLKDILMIIIIHGKNMKKNKGVSLIELLAAVAILLILSTLVIPVGNIYVLREQEFELKEELSTFRVAIENFKQKYGIYPFENEMTVHGEIIKLIENSLIRKGLLRRIPINPFQNLRVKDNHSLWEIRNNIDDVWVTLNNARKFSSFPIKSIESTDTFSPLSASVGISKLDSSSNVKRYWATSPTPKVIACSKTNINIEDIIEGDAYRIDYINGLVYANLGTFYDRNGNEYNLVNSSITLKYTYNVNINCIYDIRHSKNAEDQIPMIQLTPDDFYFTW